MRVGLVATLFGALLACSGMPTSAPSPDGAEDGAEDGAQGAAAVDDLLDAEDPKEGEGRSAEDRAERKEELTAFVAATPDFEEWRPVVVDILLSDEVAKTEEAYTKAKADFAPKPPSEVTVTSGAWKVAVVVNHAYDTSEDWGFFANDVSEALSPEGVTMASVGPGQEAMKVLKDGKELATIDLKPFLQDRLVLGYVFAKPGADPIFHGHAPPDDVTAAARAYFGGDAAPADPAEPSEPAGGDGGYPGRAKTKVKAKRPAGAP